MTYTYRWDVGVPASQWPIQFDNGVCSYADFDNVQVDKIGRGSDLRGSRYDTLMLCDEGGTGSNRLSQAVNESLV